MTFRHLQQSRAGQLLRAAALATRPAAAMALALVGGWSAADIYRWDNAALLTTATPAPGVSLSGLNLNYADLAGASLTSANLASADLIRADFYYAALTSANLSNANLSGANLYHATLTSANLAGATVNGTDFGYTTRLGFTSAQLYSTASYAARNLAGVDIRYNNLAGWNFAGQNLTSAVLFDADLAGADLTGAMVNGASFGSTTSRGFTSAQFYSTASYATGNLTGIDLGDNDLASWNFASQNLTSAGLSYATLTGADWSSATLDLADLTGAIGFVAAATTTLRGTTMPDGSISPYALRDNERLTVGLPDRALSIPGTIVFGANAVAEVTGPLVLRYGGVSSPEAQVRDRVRQGFGDGMDWTGPEGYAVPADLAARGLCVGFALSSNVMGISGSSTAPWSFGRGVSVDATSVLMAVTYAGDADMNGTVDLDDLFSLIDGYNAGAQGLPVFWSAGDFDYNGSVDLDDLFMLVDGFNACAAGGPLTPGSPVPEPGAISLLAAGAMSLRYRRRVAAGLGASRPVPTTDHHLRAWGGRIAVSGQPTSHAPSPMS